MGDAMRRALLDEFERAFVEFGEYVRQLPPDLYDAPIPGEQESGRAVIGHVIRAGYSHLHSVALNCGGRVPERRFTDPEGINDANTFVAALLDVVRFAREALEEVVDESLANRFTSRWGQPYDGEQMMEHATCHPGRHIRQLRRFLEVS